MKKRVSKYQTRWISFFLVFCMMIGTILVPADAKAVMAGQKAQTDFDYPTGLLEPVEIEMPLSEEEFLDQVLETKEQKSGETGEDLKSSAIYTSEWDRYRTHYFYNQLSDEERKFYDGLDAACSKLLLKNSNANVSSVQGETYYYTDYVSGGTMSKTHMEAVMLMFWYSNPQYYFLNKAYLTRPYGSGTYLALCIYPEFANTSRRQKATAAVKTQVDAWVSAAGTLPSEADKVRYFHDVILDKVEYNMAIYDDIFFDEDTQYTQSAYSVFCMDKTVCAGYSLAFEMLCNAVDIDTIAVTSPGHAWNKVYLGSTWYNVDLTWDDGTVNRYQFFERSDYYYDTVPDGNSPVHHKEEAEWEGRLPECPIDTVQTGDYTVPGILPPTAGAVDVPSVAVSQSGSNFIITLSTITAGADIYYTTDGSRPSPSSTKSRKYTGVIKAKTVPTLRVMAAKSGQYDSADVSYGIVGYQGNGAKSGSVAPQVLAVGNSVTVQPNSFKRSGYTFSGWNTKADGSGTSYQPGQVIPGLAGGFTLYAQWFQGKYQIVYQLGGGKNNSKNPTGYTPGKQLKLKEPVKKGYTFAGWYTNKKLTKKFTKITKSTKGTLTLYAKWKKTKYNITYQLNGGKNHKSNPRFYYITSKTIKLKNPTRSGYKFVGWYSNKKLTKKVTQIKNGSTGKLTLYAKWKKK